MPWSHLAGETNKQIHKHKQTQTQELQRAQSWGTLTSDGANAAYSQAFGLASGTQGQPFHPIKHLPSTPAPCQTAAQRESLSQTLHPGQPPTSLAVHASLWGSPGQPLPFQMLPVQSLVASKLRCLGAESAVPIHCGILGDTTSCLTRAPSACRKT